MDPWSARPRLYEDLAPWFPLLTPPGDYAEESAHYLRIMADHCSTDLDTLLELGSGGGHVASHLKAHLKPTLVDLSPTMLAVSSQLNPDCEHVPGDMRSVRLDRKFSAVLIHDAISYLVTEQDVASAIVTAYHHCAPGGVALFCPDFVREHYRPSTTHGGSDENSRSLRYLEWCWDPDPDDDWYVMEFAYLLREGNRPAEVVGDRHLMGLFSLEVWERAILTAGFEFGTEQWIPEGGSDSQLVLIGRRSLTGPRDSREGK